jgi:hypothetical protein
MGYIGKVPADVLIDPHVDSAAITDGTIITADIADDAITSAKLAQNSVDSSELIDGSVDNSHLAGSIAMNKTLLSAGTGLTLSTNTLNVDAAQSQITSVGTLSSLTLGGDLLVPQYIKHVGDTDCHIEFGTDEVKLRTGDNSRLIARNSDVEIYSPLVATSATFSGTVRSTDVFYGNDNGASNPGFRFYNAASGMYHAGSDNIGFAVSGNNVATLTASTATFAGKLGVGTSSIGASCNAEFRNSSGFTLRLSKNVQNANSGDNFGSIQFSNNNDATGAIIQGKAAGNWSTNNYPTDIIFYTAQTSDVYERFRIKNDGNSVFTGDVTIDTSSHSTLLIKGADGCDAEIALQSDDADDPTDYWSINAKHSTGGTLHFATYGSGSWTNPLVLSHVSATVGNRLYVTANLDGAFGTELYNGHATGHGLKVRGGSTSSQYSLYVSNNDQTATNFQVLGDGTTSCRGNFTSTGGVVDGDSGLKTQQAEFKRLTSNSFSNGNLHDLTQVHQRPFIVRVEDSAGGLSTMAFPIGGAGIAYNWSMFDSDSNSWTSNQATITSTGTSGNTYHFSFNSGSGMLRIQRTNGSLSFTVRVYQIAE